MAKMAFLIPIPAMLRKYQDKASDDLSKNLPFVHNLNAVFKYCAYPHICAPVPFRYNSRYDGCSNRCRCVEFTPYLLKYRIGKNRAANYAVVLIATVDKYFHGNGISIKEDEWCTAFDLVYLKRAVYESAAEDDIVKERLITTPNNEEQSLCNWLKSIISDVSGIRQSAVDLYGIISSTNITALGIDRTLNDKELVDKEVHKQFYSPEYYRMIDELLASNLDMGNKVRSVSVAQRFIYGLLYNNDNFMQLHRNSIRRVLNRFYSNNYVEAYWAVEDSILSVKIGSPFINLREAEKTDVMVSNSLDGNDCLMELCVLGMLDRELEHFSRRHNEMKPHEIELRRAQVAEYFNERILNVWEMDHRMDYFMDRFRLNRRFNRLLEVSVPRVNARNMMFTRVGAIIGWSIALLTVFITLLTFINR